MGSGSPKTTATPVPTGARGERSLPGTRHQMTGPVPGAIAPLKITVPIGTNNGGIEPGFSMTAIGYIKSKPLLFPNSALDGQFRDDWHLLNLKWWTFHTPVRCHRR